MGTTTWFYTHPIKDTDGFKKALEKYGYGKDYWITKDKCVIPFAYLKDNHLKAILKQIKITLEELAQKIEFSGGLRGGDIRKWEGSLEKWYKLSSLYETRFPDERLELPPLVMRCKDKDFTTIILRHYRPWEMWGDGHPDDYGDR